MRDRATDARRLYIVSHRVKMLTKTVCQSPPRKALWAQVGKKSDARGPVAVQGEEIRYNREHAQWATRALSQGLCFFWSR